MSSNLYLAPEVRRQGASLVAPIIDELKARGYSARWTYEEGTVTDAPERLQFALIRELAESWSA